MKLNIKRDRQVNVNVTPNWLMLLGVIFILLKVTGLTEVADWSWWLVLLPFYAGLAFFAAILLGIAAVAAAVYGLAALLDCYDKIKRKLR